MADDTATEQVRVALRANQDRALTPDEEAFQRTWQASNRARAKHVVTTKDGTPYLQDPAIVAIRDGKVSNNTVRATLFKGGQRFARYPPAPGSFPGVSFDQAVTMNRA